METSKPWAFGGGAYIATSVVLAGIAMADPDHIVIWAWAAALVCVAPSTLVLVPVLYIVGSLAWNISEHFAIRWPVTWAYMACFGAAAALNVVLLRWIAGRRNLRRNRRA